MQLLSFLMLYENVHSSCTLVPYYIKYITTLCKYFSNDTIKCEDKFLIILYWKNEKTSQIVKVAT